ncbi:hypothetical protein ISU07_13055 [Nocardioides islandensis]|uniref:Sortase n=1 Tax=Nocardioides islandensis TaxID=433663 RepID=A0A930VCI8_9ACTN|nr:hypothetical protein [Nocardioides islandensis]MBF4764057.1 hypothetical protein [Nocardioides islandensis]
MPNTRDTSPNRRRISPSLVISVLALVVATSTGAYAASTLAPKNSVVSKSIKNHEVKTKDLAYLSVRSTTLADHAVTGSKLADGSVTGAKIVDGSVAGADLGAGQVGLDQLSAAAKATLNQGGPAYSRHFETGFSVPSTMTPVQTLNLPAGSYVLSAKAQIDTANNSDIVECDLVAGTGTDKSFVQGVSTHTSQIITNSLVATFPVGGTVVWQCQTFGGGGISQGRLTAISVSSVDNQP